MDNKIGIIIPAAGSGSRMNKKINKIFIKLDDIPIIIRTIKAFSFLFDKAEIVIAAKKNEISEIEHLIKDSSLDADISVIEGGTERYDSVMKALEIVSKSCTYVMIHDAVRPFVKKEDIEKTMDAAMKYGCSILAVKSKDTIKMESDGFIGKTLDRNVLWNIQTPQIFKKEIIIKAYENIDKNQKITDDSLLVENIGYKVKLVHGSYDNIKITTEEDIKIGESILKKGENKVMVGHGFDVHRLEKDRKLILGGVNIDYHFGLLGHSDADVVVHAIIDSILGAVQMGDIGLLFPDNDPKYKDISSLKLLEEVMYKVKKDYKIVNIDVTIICQNPKLRPYILKMQENIIEIVKTDKVNIKATTTEKLGFEGEEKGISCHSICMVECKY